MKCLTIFVCCQLAICSMYGADPALQVKIIEGADVMNKIKTMSAVQPVVEVRDAQGAPVSGAEVTFQLPAAGPGGTFNGWLRTLVVQTGQDGRAAAAGLQPNREEGKFPIRVTASSGSLRGSAMLYQTNTMNGTAAGPKKKISPLIYVAGAAAAIAVAVIATHTGSSSSSSSSTPVSVSTGPITIGGPH